MIPDRIMRWLAFHFGQRIELKPPNGEPMPNYIEMNGSELLAACGDNAMKWAEAFCQIKKKRGWMLDEIDEGLMVSWFANAIETSTQVRAAKQRSA